MVSCIGLFSILEREETICFGAKSGHKKQEKVLLPSTCPHIHTFLNYKIMKLLVSINPHLKSFIFNRSYPFNNVNKFRKLCSITSKTSNRLFLLKSGLGPIAKSKSPNHKKQTFLEPLETSLEKGLLAGREGGLDMLG